MEHLELDGVPESVEGAGTHPIHKSVAQLAEGCLNAFAQTADQRTVRFPAVLGRQENQVRLLAEPFFEFVFLIGAVGNQNPSVDGLSQSGGKVFIRPVGRRQESAKDHAASMRDGMKFEAKVPALGSFAKVGTLIPQQAYPPWRIGLQTGIGLLSRR